MRDLNVPCLRATSRARGYNFLPARDTIFIYIARGREQNLTLITAKDVKYVKLTHATEIKRWKSLSRLNNEEQYRRRPRDVEFSSPLPPPSALFQILRLQNHTIDFLASYRCSCELKNYSVQLSDSPRARHTVTHRRKACCKTTDR